MGWEFPALAVALKGAHKEIAQHHHHDDDVPRSVVSWSHVLIMMEVFWFVIIDILSLQQTYKIISINAQHSNTGAPVSLTGGRTRALLMISLFVANTARTVSIILMIFINPDMPAHGDTLRNWIIFLLSSLPSLFFLTTYSIITLFWAQVYYAALLVSLPLLRPTFAFLNFAVYSVYAAIAGLTFALGAYHEFKVAGAFFVEILFLAVALGFGYFGVKVASQLSSSKTVIGSKRSIIKRVLLLAILCPLLFSFRGIYFLAFALRITHRYYPQGISKIAWDAVIFLISEGIPSALILVAFWSRKPLVATDNPEMYSSLIHNNYLGGNAVYPQPVQEPQHDPLLVEGNYGNTRIFQPQMFAGTIPCQQTGFPRHNPFQPDQARNFGARSAAPQAYLHRTQPT